MSASKKLYEEEKQKEEPRHYVVEANMVAKEWEEYYAKKNK